MPSLGVQWSGDQKRKAAGKNYRKLTELLCSILGPKKSTVATAQNDFLLAEPSCSAKAANDRALGPVSQFTSGALANHSSYTKKGLN